MMPKKKFFESEDGRQIIAKFEKEPEIIDDLVGVLDNKVQKGIVYSIELFGSMYKNTENPQLQSKAICSDSDAFSKQIGYDIASEKCDAKYHAAISSRCTYYIKILNRMIDKLDKIKSIHDCKIENIAADIERIGGGM